MDALIAGIQSATALGPILAITAGVSIGIFMGAVPGLTAAMAIALLAPITFGLDPLTAVAFLIGIYKGGTFGGSISAILLAGMILTPITFSQLYLSGSTGILLSSPPSQYNSPLIFTGLNTKGMAHEASMAS